MSHLFHRNGADISQIFHRVFTEIWQLCHVTVSSDIFRCVSISSTYRGESICHTFTMSYRNVTYFLKAMNNSFQILIGGIKTKVGLAPIFPDAHQCAWTASIEKKKKENKILVFLLLFFIPEDTIIIFWALRIENRAMLTHFWPKKLPFFANVYIWIMWMRFSFAHMRIIRIIRINHIFRIRMANPSIVEGGGGGSQQNCCQFVMAHLAACNKYGQVGYPWKEH